MRNKYLPIIILSSIVVILSILILNNGADSAKLIYIPPKEADLKLASASIQNLDVITSVVEEKALINTVVDTYLKKYNLEPTQTPSVDTKQGANDQPTANDIYVYTFIVKDKNEDILVTVQRQEGLWLNITARSVKDSTKTYSKYLSLRADTGFEGN